MERATSMRGRRGRSVAEIRQFQEYLHREGITLTEWQKRQQQLANAGDADTQALRLHRRRLQQKHTR